MFEDSNGTVACWSWDPRTGAARIRQEMAQQGLSWIDFPGIADRVENDTEHVLFELGFRNPVACTLQNVAPIPGGRGYVQTNAEGTYHVDMGAYIPPHLHILSCDKQAAKGGVTLYHDLWKLAEKIKVSDPLLYRALFDVSRITDGINTPFAGPTFSYRFKTLVSAFAPVRRSDDWVGIDLQTWLHREEPIAIKLKPGSVVVMNNHRFVHARTEFQGERRLVRALVWLARPAFRPPKEMMDLAKTATRRRTRALDHEYKWIRDKFGVTPGVRNKLHRTHLVESDRHKLTNEDEESLRAVCARLNLGIPGGGDRI